MLVKLQPGCSNQQIAAVCEKINGQGLRAHIETGVTRAIVTVIGKVNGGFQVLREQLESMVGVEGVEQISKPYKLAARKDASQKTIVPIGHDLKMGGDQLIIVAGPCSIESEHQLRTIAVSVHRSGAHVLRGGAFKPRTNPREFEGLKEDGLKMLRDIGGELGMPTQTEVMEPYDVEMVSEYADILQVGARNAQNFPLLKAVGQTRKPVVLKRGAAATYEEALGAAEYVLDGGNPNVILCERGIRTFNTITRNTADIAAIPVFQHESHLPIMFDPSHGVGRRHLIPNVALAGVAAGADSLHLETHHKPEEALSDGPQSLRLDQFAVLMAQVRLMNEARRQCNALKMNLS